MNILIVAIFSFLLNLLLGRWRVGYKKFSLPWWLIIHASIPLIIPLRIYLDTPTLFIPLFIGLAILGQFSGSKYLSRLRIEKKTS